MASVLALVAGSGGEQVAVAVAPLRMIRDSLANLGFAGVAPATLALAAFPWLVVSLGVRLVGVRWAGQALFGARTSAIATGALALSGWPLGLLFHASARDIEGAELPSATIYFVEQSGAALWIFAAVALAAWCARGRRGVLIVAGAASLSFPSTLEFALRKAIERQDAIPAAYVRAIRAIERDGRPGHRVLQRPVARYPPLPVVLAGRRVLYERFTVYLTQFASPAVLRRRHEMLFRFFRTTDRDEAREIARSLGATHLCLYGSDRVRFDGRGALTPLHEEDGARSYRLEWGAAASGAAATGVRP